MLSEPLLPLLMMLALGRPPQPVDTSPVTGARSVLHTPDAIAPAVLPYLACMYGIRGLPFLLGNNGTLVSYDNSDGNCAGERRRARAGALKRLGSRPVPGGGAPAAYVDEALAKIDDFVRSLPVQESARASARAAPVGIPFVIEDEVRPAYDQYVNCLKTQVSYSQVSVDTVLQVFNRSLEICRSVRDFAVGAAENALTKKGWDLSTRKKAVESTFATADESWLAMGQQFRDSLVAHTPGRKR